MPEAATTYTTQGPISGSTHQTTALAVTAIIAATDMGITAITAIRTTAAIAAVTEEVVEIAAAAAMAAEDVEDVAADGS